VAFLAGNRFFLMVDEAQHAGKAGLEWLRRLAEEARIGAVFAGSVDLAELARTMPQFRSRMARPCLVLRAGPADMAALAAAHGFGDPASLDHPCGLAGTRGNLRDVVKVPTLARLHAGDGPADAGHVAAALAEMRLRPGRRPS
jgi:hypothetical protein